MKNHPVERLMGAVVVAIAAIFPVFAYTTSDVRPITGDPLTTRFDRVDGLSIGGDVSMSGVKIGSVVRESLDQNTSLPW